MYTHKNRERERELQDKRTKKNYNKQMNVIITIETPKELSKM